MLSLGNLYSDAAVNFVTYGSVSALDNGLTDQQRDNAFSHSTWRLSHCQRYYYMYTAYACLDVAFINDLGCRVITHSISYILAAIASSYIGLRLYIGRYLQPFQR